MEKKEIISVRLDKDTIDKIDAYVDNASYYKRSDVIRILLEKAVDATIFVDGKVSNTFRSLYNLKFSAEYRR